MRMKTTMKIQAVIAAAGQGLRLKTEVPKALVMIRGRPVVAHAWQVFTDSPLVHSIITVAPADHFRDFQTASERFTARKVIRIIPGGATRSLSVAAGLQAVDPDTDIVLIHDAARPLVTGDMIRLVALAAKEHRAAIVAVPVKPTLKRVDRQTMMVQETLDRDEIWEVQTPQAFQRDVILEAHRRFADEAATDDAALVERMGVAVHVVRGDYRNLKITTPDDLLLAESLLRTGNEELNDG